MNNITKNNYKSLTPEVGMGATELCYSDRHPFTIIEVNDKTIVVQQDHATRIDDNGMSDAQSYTFSPNPDGKKCVLRQNKDGHWVETPKGNPNVFMLGHRESYYDYSF